MKTYGLKVIGLEGSISIEKSLELYIVHSTISFSSKTPDEITFPKDSNAEQSTMELPADSYFVGPIVKYSIECPYCGQQIKLVDHVTHLASGDDLENIKGFYFFEDKSRLWALNDSGVFVTDENLTLEAAQPFAFQSPSIHSLGWAEYNGKLIVLMMDSTNSTPYFVTVASADGSRENLIISGLIPLVSSPLIRSAQAIKALGNRIFVLDNNFNAKGNGAVLVYTITTEAGVTTIAFEWMIDYKTFGL